MSRQPRRPRPLEVTVDPDDVGLSGARLRRLDRFLAELVEAGRLPGYLVAVTRRGHVAHVGLGGWRDVDRRRPVEADTIFRIYSMTKPITSVTAMSLFEEGAFGLDDPVSAYLPSFADLRVYAGGSADRMTTRRAAGPLTIRQLMTHTAGLTYGFHRRDPVDELYRRAGFDIQAPAGMDLAQACDTWAAIPLVHEPGAEWNYSVATDVLGRVVEVIAGKPLGDVMAERVLDPLGMADTGFAVTAGEDRLAELYGPVVDGMAGFQVLDSVRSMGLSEPAGHFGGGGLVSTGADYVTFAHMLLAGGVGPDARVLGPRTVDFMHRNHLPGGVDLAALGRPVQAESPMRGVGFGLAGSVVLDPVAVGYPAGVGQHGWGGAASTYFWIDPSEDVVFVLMAQLLPAASLPIRATLHQLVHQAIVDSR